MLPFVHARHSYFRQIRKSRSEAYRVGNAARSCLKFVGQIVIYRPLERYVGYHIAASVIWACRLKQLLFSVHNAYSGRSKYLMPRENKEIGIKCGNIYRNMSHGLCSVYQYAYTVSVRDRNQFLNRCHRSEDV